MDLLDWTDRQIRENKRSHINLFLASILNRLGINQATLDERLHSIGKRYSR
ncbi:hypothetical protein VIBNISOn1_30139 [Vibrio nigripulchritudo SOn1]|uniref:Transposase n=1 Tax=Vibrio nigripulchritudo SOn1 TaxID=1238450 RepID=A0AAV2VRT1_9VIBR|nr:hypothetical protein VIBNISOn1_30139 [Vibrio nigripulchritudo SOn1]